MTGPERSAHAAPTDGGSHFSCALTAVLINRVRRVAGDDAVARLLREAASPRTLEYLEDIGNWVSYDEAVALWDAGATVTGDEHFARHIGEDTVKRLAGSSNSAVLRGLGSPEELLRRIPVAGQRFSVAATLEAVEVRSGYAEIRAFANPGFTRHRRHCEWTAGLLTQTTLLFGLPPATVEEESCQAAGAPAVVDCDRVSVYLWDEDRGEMVRRAINATERGGRADAGLVSVAPGDVPQLARWLAHPTSELLFIDLDSSPIRHALRDLGAVASVAVPISTDEHFLGCLVVSVLERPERLTPTGELQDRLSGVAAHAVTALENGRLVDHITHQASHDQLTGVANRVGFAARLSSAIGSAGTPARSLALFYLDLDAFKPVNDSFGHDVGDELLRAVAKRLHEVVRSADTVARVGGDEFVVLVEDVADDGQIAALASRLERAFTEPFAVGDELFAIGASIGRAVWPLDVDTPDALLAHADAAMYAVKRTSRA